MQIIGMLLNPEYWKFIQGPMEYHGYFGGFENERDLEEMAADNANFLSPNNIIYHPEEKESHSGRAHFASEEFFSKVREHYRALDAGMPFDVCVGLWNNGLFPYYQSWFYEKYPDIVSRDEKGELILASMFGDLKPWVNFEEANLNRQVGAFIQDVVKALEDCQNLKYWVNGGEMLYATYCFPQVLTDYSEPAKAHFRLWLAERYADVRQLNGQWKTAYGSFETVEPPKAWGLDVQTLDWHHFRMQSMGEFFSYNYNCIRKVDRERPIFCIYHGDIFHEHTYSDMGESVQWMGLATDGYATSQILCNNEKPGFNYQYLKAMTSMGRPMTCQALANVSYREGSPVNDTFTSWDARKSLYQCLGTGVWHAGLVQWKGSLPDGDWQIYGKEVQAGVRQVFHELESLREYFAFMSPAEPELGIYIPEAQWLLGGWCAEWDSCTEWALHEGIHFRYLYDRDLEGENLKGVKVILCYATTLVEEKMLEYLEAFAAKGGKVIIAQEDTDGSGFLRHNPGLGFRSCTELTEGMEYTRELFGRVEQGHKVLGKGEVFYLKSTLEAAMLDRIFYYRKPLKEFCLGRILEIAEACAVIRPCRLEEGARGLEVYTLTDGTHLGVVLINEKEQPVSGTLRVDPRILQRVGPLHSVADPVNGAAVVYDKETVSIQLEGLGTQLLFLQMEQETVYSLEETDARLTVLEGKGFDVGIGRMLLDRAAAFGLDVKKKAAARLAESLIYLKLERQGDHLLIRTADIEGVPVKAEISAYAPSCMSQAIPVEADSGFSRIKGYAQLHLRDYDHTHGCYRDREAAGMTILFRAYRDGRVGTAQYR